MRHTAISSAFISLVIFLLAACGNADKVKLVATNCTGEVPSKTNLQFTFNKDVVPDSLLRSGGWQTDGYVKFNPEIAGRFRWQNSNTLVFSPENGLPPASAFTASITSEVCKYSKFKLGNIEKLAFHTPLQHLENAAAQWIIKNETTREVALQVELELRFMQEVSALQKQLSVKVNGQEKAISLQANAPSEKFAFTIQNLKLEDKDYNIQIVINKGLLPIAGKLITTEQIVKEINVVSPYILNINNLEATHDGNEGSVRIFTSQQLIAQDFKGIKIAPAVKFTTAINSDGLLISSADFNANKTYELTIEKGLKGAIGGVLKETYINTIGFGEVEPSITISDKTGKYLDAKGSRNIEVKIVNVPKVKVVITKVYENNLLAANRYGVDSRYYDEYEGYNESSYSPEASFGDVIYEEEIESSKLQKHNDARLFNFNIQDKLGDYKGVYHIELRSTSDYWVRDSRMVSISDIGLIAKQTPDNLMVFANGIKAATAMGNAEIKVYGSNNQLVGTGTTDGNGIAFVSLKKHEFIGFKPALITAKHGNDFNFILLNATRVETSRFDVGGKRINSTGLDAFIYGERDMYRPGEMVNITAIIRTADWKTPGEIPVKMKLKLPNGQELKSLRKTLNAQGAFETSFELSPSAVTGSYLYELYTSNDILLATKSILVEEFMPDRIKVSAALNAEKVKHTDTIILKGTAFNNFGPPAAGRSYEVELQYSAKQFQPKQFSKYDFNLSNRETYFESVVREGTTSEDGSFVERFSPVPSFSNNGIIKASFFTTVFDETGRPVNRFASSDIATQKEFIGVNDDDYYYYPLNQNIRFNLVAVNASEQVVSAKVNVQVIKHEYKTVLSKSWNYFRYESQRDDKIVAEQTLNISGEGTVYNFVPRTSGDYELRVSLPGAKTYIQRSFYSYGSWGNSSSNFEVNKEGNVDISLDKEKYQTGESAKLLFKTPFNGKLLVTVERDNVFDKFYLNVENRTASASISLKENYLPNVYVTATLIKPHEESDLPLTVAHGFKNITVEMPSRNIAMKINAPEKVRSNTHQKITVNAAPNSPITLAVVDEGILQITNYKTPNPYPFFYEKRALQVNSFDLYPSLFPEVSGAISSVGGDGFDLSKRTNPLTNKRVKLVRYWSGIQQTNSSGTATFEFDIPQFSGELRLMAVNYVNEKFGATDAYMKVADPVVVSVALPRFLSPGDEIDVPVTLTNTTAKNTDAKASIKIDGPVKVIGESVASTSLKPNAEGKVMYRLQALQKIGEASITVQVNAAGETFTDKTDITVRPAASLQKATGSGIVNAGENKTLNFNVNEFIAGTTSYSLIVSNSPMVEFGKKLSDLVRYPHGCTEQVISAAFPQMYFADLSQALGTDNNNAKAATYNIQEAIRKIKMRQLYNGAVSLWDGGNEHWWSSVYAAHFLIEAKKAGYEVDDKLMEPLLTYLTNKLRDKTVFKYFYNRGDSKMIAAKEIPYSLYVLALANKPQSSSMSYYKANTQLLSLDGRYLLACAYALSGDKGKFAELLPASFTGEIADKDVGNSFYSDARDEALALNVLLEADPSHPQIAEMAKHVSENLKTRKYFSTQESVFSLLALGKIARANKGNNIKAQVKANGKLLGEMNNNTLKLSPKQLKDAKVEITTSGTGKLYYFWQAEGIPVNGEVKEEDNYLRVRRTFYDRYGRVIAGNTFKQNDLVIVGITLENVFSRTIENIVITDMLPAGFEIENPRTKEIPGMNWIKNESTAEHIDVRDDRINLFVNAGNNKQTFYYAVRAVSPGTFKQGVVSADAMYAGEYHSYNGSGTVIVSSK